MAPTGWWAGGRLGLRTYQPDFSQQYARAREARSRSSCWRPPSNPPRLLTVFHPTFYGGFYGGISHINCLKPA